MLKNYDIECCSLCGALRPGACECKAEIFMGKISIDGDRLVNLEEIESNVGISLRAVHRVFGDIKIRNKQRLQEIERRRWEKFNK